MRNRHLGLLVLLGLVVVAGVLVVYPRFESRAVAQFSSKGKFIRPQLTRLQVDLFELRCGRDQLLKLDLMAVGQGEGGPMKASAEQVLQRLRQLGEASLAVRYDNFVDLASKTRFATGKSVPTIESVSVSAGGVVVPAVKYHDLGFNVQVVGVWMEESDPNLAQVQFDLESSGLPNETIDAGYVGEDAKLTLPVYDQFESEQHVILRQGQPVLLACNNLAKPADDKGLPILIARLVATRLIE